MKRIKFPVAALGAVLAAIGAFSSAFTPSAKFANYTFFNKTQAGNPNPLTKSAWQYRPSGGCQLSTSTSCSVIYSQLTVPTTDAIPSSTATYVTNSVVTNRQWNGL
ncbi:hypothetical protein [Chitinophaga sp. YIM B06452]|uniref:hypothetical protein n=1 Tax=Chitinophaga sp. YIM B06452 TaxID=3082158 RepID=UPI0031FEB9DE